jgi:hypothetical protein
MSDNNLPTRFYKVVTHDNNGETKILHAAWRDRTGALFTLREPAVNGYVASDPNAEPDPTAKRDAWLLELYKNVRSQADLQGLIEKFVNLDFMDELADRPPIGDVLNARDFPGDELILGALFT